MKVKATLSPDAARRLKSLHAQIKMRLQTNVTIDDVVKAILEEHLIGEKNEFPD